MKNIDRMTDDWQAEADYWQAQARRYAESADDWRAEARRNAKSVDYWRERAKEYERQMRQGSWAVVFPK